MTDPVSNERDRIEARLDELHEKHTQLWVDAKDGSTDEAFQHGVLIGLRAAYTIIEREAL